MKIKCSYSNLLEINDPKIIPNPKNPNDHSPKQLEQFAKILNYQGQRKPIIISNQSGFIVTGHGTLMAAKLAGSETIAVDFQDFDSPAMEYSHVVADNAVALQAELDRSKINTEIPNLGDDFDLENLGIPDLVLEPTVIPMCDEDDVPERVEPRTKLGDIYQLGNHRLMCGDSTSIDAVEKPMRYELADLVFTDPPYGVSYDGGHADKGIRREKLANDDSTLIYNDSVPMMFNFSKPKAALYLWFAATKSLQVLQDNGYEIRSWLIWNKNMAQFGAIGAQYKQKHEPCLYAYKKGQSPFWDGPTNEVSVWDEKRESKNEFHPTQKPVELSKRTIRNSCPKNGIVLDLFGGSGATLIGAETENRSARLMELDPHYCDVIVARWEKYTGQKAQLI